MTETRGMPDPGTFLRWLESLKERDPRLYDELRAKMGVRLQTEGVSLESTTPEGMENATRLVLETIVRSGRPALFIRNQRIDSTSEELDQTAAAMVTRLRGAAPVIEPLFPLVGRIDVANYPGTMTYAGTGWYIAEDVIVTNRHVADLVARWDGRQYVFLPGRFGDDLEVSVDFRHEQGENATDVVRVLAVLCIERNPAKADFALLKVGRRADGTRPKFITIAESDAAAGTDIAVVGYPARAPAHIIPDQAWMDRIYGKAYDVKRVAPGQMMQPNRGWATHDATTLGGNSGSVVLDMKSGNAVALHFAGAYMIENYCVPSSMLQPYRTRIPEILTPAPAAREEPEQPKTPRPAIAASQTQSPAPQTQSTSQTTVSGGDVTFTIPLTIKVSLGAPVADGSVTVSAGTPSRSGAAAQESKRVLEAARALGAQLRGNGVYAVRHGYLIERNRLSDTPCLVVSADPSRIDDVRARVPRQFEGFPVDVRPAPLSDQDNEAAMELAAEATMTIAYDDDARKGEGFSFNWVKEEMDLLLHVGPERSWTVLSEFLGRAERRLVSSIYEFHAAHIADALERELDEGTELTLVMAQQSRDPRSGDIKAGDFDRSDRFEKWDRDHGEEQFARVFVPIGSTGLVARSYHIKVTVRDDDTVWLSSGNWKRHSQPKIAQGDLNDPRATSRAGNREWHVVVRNETLASRFQNHILADYERSLELGGTLEAVEEPKYVDVPAAALESLALEAPARRVFEPRRIQRVVRVKPLLTPDREGEVYSSAVLKLIRSARKQLLFQNQYISVNEHSSGFFGDLVDALVEKSNEVEDVRVLLRSGGGEFWDHMAELKRRGMDVNRCVRRVASTHTKGIIVDGKRVLVGSHNWSSLGVTLNRDASLLFHDEEVAQYYAEVFEEDWARASETEERESVAFAEAPRMAAGDAPPRGFVRIPLSEYLEG